MKLFNPIAKRRKNWKHRIPKLSNFVLRLSTKFTKVAKLILPVILLTLTYTGCDTTEPPHTPPQPEIKDTVTINVTQTTHRSITLHVQTTAHHQNRTVELYRSLNQNDTLAAAFPLTVKDTTIIDDNNGEGLTIDTEYGYFAVTLDSTGTPQDTTEKQTAKTLVPTSHDYDWQEITIGEWQSSLSDVWGTDEDNVYAVGSLTINGESHSVLHYDGNDWTPIDDTAGGFSIYGFGENDIWVVGGGVYHYTDDDWKRVDAETKHHQNYDQLIPKDTVFFNNSPYTSLWGTSSENLYLGNNDGKIVHWDGVEGEVVYEPPQDGRIEQIDGLGDNFIIGIGYKLTPPTIATIYNGVSWKDYSTVDVERALEGVAIISKKEIYFAGNFIFKVKNNVWIDDYYDTGYYINHIDYNRKSGEIVVAGDRDGVSIHNGVSWKNYRISKDDIRYWGLHAFENTKFIVGGNGSQAKILIGKRK